MKYKPSHRDKMSVHQPLRRNKLQRKRGEVDKERRVRGRREGERRGEVREEREERSHLPLLLIPFSSSSAPPLSLLPSPLILPYSSPPRSPFSSPPPL